jgi:hypothetical protein
MSLQLGDIAPNFNASTTVGDIDFHEFLGDSWGYYFHILQISHQYVLLNLEEQPNLKANFLREM